MTARQRNNAGDQLTFLAPSEATLVELVRRNRRLLAELRSTYQAASGETAGRIIHSPGDGAALLTPAMARLTREQVRLLLPGMLARVRDHGIS